MDFGRPGRPPGSILPLFLLLFGSILAPFRSPGGARGAPEGLFLKGPVSETLFGPFGVHFGSILGSILGSFWGIFLILFSISFYNEFWCLLGAILVPFWLDFGVVLRLEIYTNSH